MGEANRAEQGMGEKASVQHPSVVFVSAPAS